MKTARSNLAVGVILTEITFFMAAVLLWLLLASDARADGCFVFRWNNVAFLAFTVNFYQVVSW
jgi:hypothetical protein